MSALARAFEDFRAIVGEENVLVDDESTRAVARATFPTTQTVPAIVRPGDTAQVRACVRVAREHHLPLYPISRGRNIGYGSAVPVRSGCVVLDLARMARILEVNEELAYVVLEPGVTLQQLHTHLREKGSRLFASVGGAVPDASIVGHALERGIGRGPLGDRFGGVCNLEVVLGNGEVVETGFGRFPGARASDVFRWSVGPYGDGLFTQSNFGVVTRMTVWLTPMPDHLETSFFRIDSSDRLGSLVEGIRELRLRGIFRGPVLLANDCRIFSFDGQYPWSDTGGETPLPPPLRESMRRRLGVPAWGGDGALYAYTAAQARAEREQVQDVLGPRVDRLEFVGEEQARNDPRRGWRDMNAGVPNARSLFPTYWRKRSAPPPDMDPHRDGVGILWYAPALPATAGNALEVVQIVEEVCARHALEPNAGFQFANERGLVMTGALFWDRTVEGEDERAIACYGELRRRLDAAGYYPYRVSTASMGSLPECRAYDDVIRAVKQACDPDGIIAPDRYVLTP